MSTFSSLAIVDVADKAWFRSQQDRNRHPEHLGDFAAPPSLFSAGPGPSSDVELLEGFPELGLVGVMEDPSVGAGPDQGTPVPYSCFNEGAPTEQAPAADPSVGVPQLFVCVMEEIAPTFGPSVEGVPFVCVMEDPNGGKIDAEKVTPFTCVMDETSGAGCGGVTMVKETGAVVPPPDAFIV